MPLDELNTIRKKYPGAYDDLSDGDLAGMLATKYPAYRDLPDRVKAETPQAPALAAPQPSRFAEPPKSLLQKLGEAGQSGVEDLGRSLLSVYKSLDPTQASSALEAGAAPIMAGMLATPPAAASVVAGEATRKAAELSGMPPWLQALAGTTAGLAVPGSMIPLRRAPTPAPVRAPVRTIDDLIQAQRPGIPPPAEMKALPPPAGPRSLPEPEMVMQGTPPLETPGGATIASDISRAPKRTIVDLVDEIKQDLKDRVIQELSDELRTGKIAAMPRREVPKQIAPPRLAEAPTTEIPSGAPIELPPPKPPKIEMGKSGYRGEKYETKPKFTAATPIEDVLPPRVAKAKPIPLGEYEEVAPGTVRLYRGQTGEYKAPVGEPKLGETERGRWFATDQELAKFHGQDVAYVDVPKEVADAAMVPDSMFGKSGRLLPQEYASQAKRLKAAPRELPEEAPFDVPSAEIPAPAISEGVDSSKLRPALVLKDGEVISGNSHAEIYNALSPAQQKRIESDGFVDSSGNLYKDVAAARQGRAEAIKAEPAAPPVRKVKGPQGGLIEVAPEQPALMAKEPELALTKEAPATGMNEAQAKAVDDLMRRVSTNKEILLRPTRVVRNEHGQVRIEYVNPENNSKRTIVVYETGELGPGSPGPAGKNDTVIKNLEAQPPKPVPSSALSPEERAAADDMRGMLGGKKARGLTGILESEKGAINIGKDDPLAALRPEHEMGKAEVARRSLINRVDPTLRKMGPTGTKFANELQEFYYASEQRKAAVSKKIDDIFDKYPGVEDTLMQRLESGGKGTAKEVAAYREIKKITDEIGDEAVNLKIKVKNPITGQEREFRKRERYAPHIIDPNKVSKNPTRLLDQIQEELIADGIEPGAARTQAANIIRNASRTSGNLQFIRTQPKLDPDIHITNAREAYKRAAVGEVERIEALKRFGIRDKDELLGNELGGIRNRTADISAEAGPDAAQKAELWARRQIGIPETPDPTMKAAGQFMRNFNTLKLGFLPVTNLAAQAPQILAAGKTTRFNPVKALEAIRQAFGKREGYELARVYGTAIDKMSDDLLSKLELSTRGPGGKAATAFLHITGGSKSENYVAKLAAYVGHEDAKAVIQKLIDNPQSASAAKAARLYGLSPEKVLKEGMTEENLFRAARHFTDETLLRGNVLNLPGAYTSESGKVLLQFKRATQMLANQMFDAAKNDPTKFIALVAASQIGGEALEDIKAGVRGTVAALFSGDPNRITQEIQRRPEGVRRIINNFAAAVSLGYLGDTVMDLLGGKDPKALISGISVAASPVESAFNVIQGAGRIARGEAEKDFPKFRDTAGQQIARAVTREVAGGTFVRGLTYSSDKKTERQKFAEELGLKRESDSRAKMKKQLGLSR